MYIGGQKQASRVSKMIQMCTRKIKKLLEKYKNLQVEYGEDLQLGIAEVLNLESPFWRTEHSYSVVTPCDRLPAESQRRLLELSSLKDRAQEEKQLCIGDLIRIYVSYRENLDEVNCRIVQCLQQHDNQLIHPLPDDDVFISLEQSVHSLPRPIAGEVSALLLTRHLSTLKMKRACTWHYGQCILD